MRGNIPIPEIPHGEDLWLIVLITSVRERRTQQGRLFCDASARNATGSIALKIWGEVREAKGELKPGLWGITGKLETFQDRSQFVVAEYRPITLEQKRRDQATRLSYQSWLPGIANTWGGSAGRSSPKAAL